MKSLMMIFSLFSGLQFCLPLQHQLYKGFLPKIIHFNNIDNENHHNLLIFFFNKYGYFVQREISTRPHSIALNYNNNIHNRLKVDRPPGMKRDLKNDYRNEHVRLGIIKYCVS